VDDLALEEAGLTNVVRRAGAPLTVESEQTGMVYEEGADYAPISDPQIDFLYDHEGPAIRLAAGSRIPDGERLRVSYYHAVSINSGQVGVCMSEPRVHDIIATNAALLWRVFAPRRWMLSVDEIRAGGSDLACRSRGLSMAQILGDFITRAMAAIRDVNPDAEIFSWSDMLDPHHNAHGNYYLVDGDYTGSWRYIPADLRIVCWYYDKRRPSLDFFSGLGFLTLGAAYYDGDDLSNPRGWLEALRVTPGAMGIMYTTWQNKYALLADFGDLVSAGP